MDGWSHQRQVEPTWSSRFPAAMRSSFITSRIPTIPPGLAGGPLTLLFNGFLPFRQTTILYSFFSNARESLLFLSIPVVLCGLVCPLVLLYVYGFFDLVESLVQAIS